MTASDPKPRPPYSPERRTALVLTGTGTDGAYHAGTIRALTEAGVRVGLVIAVLVAAARARRRLPARRDQRGGAWWTLLATPMAGDLTSQFFIGGLWDLLRGGAQVGQPSSADLSRRYAELLAENLGQ